MIKQKKILINFILWCLGLFLICCVGISNVFALEYYTSYADIQAYYDNSGSSATRVTANWNESLQAYVSNAIPTTANSYGALVVFNSPVPIIANHTYTISFNFPQRYNLALSSKPNLAIGNDITGTAYNYTNNQPYATTLQKKVVNNSILQYVFTATGSASYIAIPWTTTSTTSQSYFVDSFVIEDLGSEGVSAQTIQDKLDSQAYYINQNITYMQEQIIANQNTNNQEVIRTIDGQLQTCRDSYNIWDPNQIWNLGVYNWFKLPQEDTRYYLSIKLKEGKTIPSNLYIRFTNTGSYNNNIKYKDIIREGQLVANKITNEYNNDFLQYVSVYPTAYSNNLTEYFDIMLSDKDVSYEPYGLPVCKNKIDDVGDKVQESTNAINGLNDSINDDNSSGATSEASSFFGNFNTNTFGLTSIITAPLNLIQSLTSKTCTPLHLPLPYLNNKYLDLPCMSTLYSEYFGNFYTLYQTITYGIIAYWVCVRIFNLVKDFKNPEHDEIEVVDL